MWIISMTPESCCEGEQCVALRSRDSGLAVTTSTATFSQQQQRRRRRRRQWYHNDEGNWYISSKWYAMLAGRRQVWVVIFSVEKLLKSGRNKKAVRGLWPGLFAKVELHLESERGPTPTDGAQPPHLQPAFSSSSQPQRKKTTKDRLKSHHLRLKASKRVPN